MLEQRLDNGLTELNEKIDREVGDVRYAGLDS